MTTLKLPAPAPAINWRGGHKFPVTTALAEQLTRPDIERRFFFGLDLLIDGLTGKAAD